MKLHDFVVRTFGSFDGVERVCLRGTLGGCLDVLYVIFASFLFFPSFLSLSEALIVRLCVVLCTGCAWTSTGLLGRGVVGEVGLVRVLWVRWET